MRFLLAFFFILGLSPNGSAAAEQPQPPPTTLVLFVASWCAPCRVELGDLPAISAAAKPFATLVLPLDEGAATAAMLRAVPPAQRWEPGPGLRAWLRTDVLAGEAGLPLTVVLDRHGHPCARWRGELNPARARVLVAQCDKGA